MGFEGKGREFGGKGKGKPGLGIQNIENWRIFIGKLRMEGGG